MRKIDVSQIVDPSIQQPFTGLSLAFLQDGNSQMVYAICKSVIQNSGRTYSASVPYLFSSDSNTGSTSDGVVFFNGELYVMNENTAGDPYAIVDTTPDPVADPLLFTDAVNRNVHNNRYLTYQVSGTGALFAIADIVNIAAPTTTAITSFLNSWTATANTPKYSKAANGLVSLRGIFTKSGAITSSVMTNLPVGYRPSQNMAFIVYLNDSTVIKSCEISIATGGDITMDATNVAGSTTTLVGLDGVNFYTD